MPYRRKKLTFAISSPDEFLFILCARLSCPFRQLLSARKYTNWYHFVTYWQQSSGYRSGMIDSLLTAGVEAAVMSRSAGASGGWGQCPLKFSLPPFLLARLWRRRCKNARNFADTRLNVMSVTQRVTLFLFQTTERYTRTVFGSVLCIKNLSIYVRKSYKVRMAEVPQWTRMVSWREIRQDAFLPYAYLKGFARYTIGLLRRNTDQIISNHSKYYKNYIKSFYFY